MFTNNSYKISHNALKVEPGERPQTNRRIQINREGTVHREQIIQTFANTLICAYTHFPTHVSEHVYK